jgi:hypothetical protein
VFGLLKELWRVMKQMAGNYSKEPADKYTEIAKKGHFCLNKGRQQFLEFVLERVKADKEAEATTVISDFFKRQDAGVLTHNDIAETEWSIIVMLKPEHVEEFKRMTQQSAKDK